MATFNAQPGSVSERLSGCVAKICRKLSRPEFKERISTLPEKVAERKRQEKEYKAQRLRDQLSYLARHVAKDERLTDQDNTKLRNTHRFRGFHLRFNAKKQVPKSLWRFLKKRDVEYRFPGSTEVTTKVYWDLDLNAWIPVELTEEKDDPHQSFYLLIPWLVDAKSAPDIKRKHDPLEILTTLVLVCEAIHPEYHLLPNERPPSEDLLGPFDVDIQMIRKLANDSWAPSLEVWLDFLVPEGGEAASQDSNALLQNPEPTLSDDGNKRTMSPKGKTVDIINLFRSGKSVEEVVEATGTSADNARQIESRWNRGRYKL